MSQSQNPIDSIQRRHVGVPAGLAGLERLGRTSELDMRPVLLRVLTDLYISRPHHSFEEIRQFETIALGLLDRIDPDTRAIVAGKLADCGAMPAALAEKFLTDGGAAAAAILARTHGLPRHLLTTAAAGDAADLAAAVAGRVDLDAELCEILANRPEIEIARALAANAAAPLSAGQFLLLVQRAIGERQVGAALCLRTTDARLIAPLFLYASHTQRAAILLAARRDALGAPRLKPTAIETGTAAEIELAAINRDEPLLAAIVARALGASLPVAREILADPQGEAVALVLCALHVDADAAARIFMRLDAKIAHSFERVQSLTRLVADLPASTAMRLVRRMTRSNPPPQRAPSYVAASDAAASGVPSRASDNARLAERPRRGGLLFMRRKA